MAFAPRACLRGANHLRYGTVLYPEIFGVFPTICLYFTNGYVLGLQSIIVPKLRDSSLKLTVDQESWLVSISILMVFPADSTCGLLADAFGRKCVLIIALIPQILTCTILYFAEEYNTYFAAFLIAGFWGAGFFVGPIHMGEISSPKYRGTFLNSKVAALHLGLAVAHCLGNFLHWRTLTLCGLFPNLIGLLAAFMVRESPAWLASKGRFDESKKSFAWYRGNHDGKELDKLIEQQSNVLERKRNAQRQGFSFQRIVMFLKHPGLLKAVAICSMCYTFVETCGKQLFIAYAFDTINSLVSDRANVFYYALSLDLADVLFLSLSCVIVKKFSRRALIFGVGIPAVVILLFITLLSFLTTKGFIPVQYSFITFALLSIYFAMLNMAVIPNLFAATGELYPLSHRAVGAIFSGFLFIMITFTVTKITPFILRQYDIYGTFLINIVISSIALLYLYLYLPETSKRTLQDIEEVMEKRKETLVEIELRQKMLKE